MEQMLKMHGKQDDSLNENLQIAQMSKMEDKEEEGSFNEHLQIAQMSKMEDKEEEGSFNEHLQIDLISKRAKLQDKEEDSLNVNLLLQNPIGSPINWLNCDCLMHVFAFISDDDRFIIGQVCRRWRRLNKIYWQRFKELNFTIPPLNKIPITNGRLSYFLHFCPNIQLLDISSIKSQIVDSPLKLIAKKCTLLEELRISSFAFRLKGLKFLASGCPFLKNLTIEACALEHSSYIIALLERCTTIESLSLKGNAINSADWLGFLKAPLKQLLLEYYYFNPGILQMGLMNVKETLEALHILGCPSMMTGNLYSIINYIPNVKTFGLTFAMETFEGLDLLLSLNNMEYLNLESNEAVNSEFFERLAAQCQHLKHLYLSGIDGSKLSETSLRDTKKLINLTHFSLKDSPCVTDNLLLSLSSYNKQLRSINLMGCVNITAAGCIQLIASLPQLEYLDLRSCPNVVFQEIQTVINKYPWVKVQGSINLRQIMRN